MTEIDIDIKLIDRKYVSEETRVDYIPFGMKVLKLQIRKLSGPAKKVWVRTKEFKRDQDPCSIYGFADDGEDLIAVWGAGDIMGFGASYKEQAGTKKPVVLDDNEPHTIYLHLIHRPIDPKNHILRDRLLTVVAVISSNDIDDYANMKCGERQHQDRIVAEKTFTLSVPVSANDPIRPIWIPRGDGSGSDILLEGKSVPRYVPRWWPSRQVEYETALDCPHISLDYVMNPDDDEGSVYIYLSNGEERMLLAQIEGHLTLPIYAMRWFVPELYHFYDGQMYVLRLTFFWLDEHIDADDLLRFLPPDHKQAQRNTATKAAEKIMSPGFLGKGWGQQYEIPDVERFDIVFNPKQLKWKYACSDAHWREYWVRVEPDQAVHCYVAAPKDAFEVVFNNFKQRLRFIGKDEPEAITNPLEEGRLVNVITENRCKYDREKDQIVCVDHSGGLFKASGWLGKNAPSITNAKLMDAGLSSDVLEG